MFRNVWLPDADAVEKANLHWAWIGGEWVHVRHVITIGGVPTVVRLDEPRTAHDVPWPLLRRGDKPTAAPDADEGGG